MERVLAPPPSYSVATHSSEQQQPLSHSREERRLPEGWVRHFDKRTDRPYYIDTTADPPRSIWRHLLDDEEYLDSLVPHDTEHRNYAPEYHNPGHESSRSSFPEESPSRSLESSTNQSHSNGAASSWARRFGHGIEDDLRWRYGIAPREGGPDDPRALYHDEVGNEGYIMGRGGRFARPSYLDNRFGYGYGGRWGRRGLLTHAINASLTKDEPTRH